MLIAGASSLALPLIGGIVPLAAAMRPSCLLSIMLALPIAASGITGFYPGTACAAAISAYYYVVPSVPLKGADLIEHAKQYPERFPSKTDLVAASGHVRENGKVSFISFYEALLEAKLGADPNYHVTLQDAIDEDKEFDALSLPLQELYNDITDKFGEKWTHRQTLDFMAELDDLGITTAQQLEDAFYTVIHHPNYHWEREFAEEYYCELDYSIADSPVACFIDWQRAWDHQLTYDFSTIEFDNSVFILHNNY